MDSQASQLVIQYVPLAKAIGYKIFKRTSPHSELDECTSLALMGLTVAADGWEDYCQRNGYNPEDTHYFVAYAKRRIIGMILDEFRRKDHASRSDRDVEKIVKAFQDAHPGESFSRAEIAQRLNIPTSKVTAPPIPLSVDVLLEESCDIPDSFSVESSAVANATLASLAEFISTMPFVEQVIIALHYYENMQLKDICTVMGLTNANASHIHGVAVLKIYAHLRSALASQADD